MNEIDFLPKWYKTSKRRQINYRRQCIIIVGVFVTLIAWSFSASISISMVEAQVDIMNDSLKNNKEIAQRYARLESSLSTLQQKANILDKLDSGVNISAVLAELSFLVEDKITLTELDVESEIFAQGKKSSGSSVRLGSGRAGKVDPMPPANIRYKVVVSGSASSSADVTGLIARLEESDYFCQIIPGYLRNIKNTVATKFEISFYVANYSLQ